MSYIPITLPVTEIGTIVQAKCTELGIPLVMKGTQYPGQDVPDFILYDWLGTDQMATHKITHHAEFQFQLIAYSIPSYLRPGRELLPHMELAEHFRSLLDRRKIEPVNKIACIQIFDSKIIPLDLRSLKSYSPQIDVETPPLHLMSVVLLFSGVYYAIN
jgi:hypothetical protein